MKKIMVVLACVLMLGIAQSQNVERYLEIVQELSFDKYQGRGYANDGVRMAGKYIENEFRAAKVDEIQLQPYTININTYPGDMRLSVDGRDLVPGQDFVMREYSPGAHCSGKLYYVDTANFNEDEILKNLKKKENDGCFVVCDFYFTYRHPKVFQLIQQKGEYRNAGMIYVWQMEQNLPMKFYKAYGDFVAEKPIVWVSSNFPTDADQVSMDIDHRFIENYESNNVIAKVAGENHDSCYVFTAHYDHLGNLGRELYYPGVNDNASGTAAIINLASFYVQNRPKYDIYFIALSGEEANLRGSTYFVNHPLFPLERIKYLVNLDMIGDDNPEQYCEASDPGMRGFKLMRELNDERHYFADLKLGELAGNSDHYPFAQKGVPCLLFENEEGSTFPYYHTYRDDMSMVVVGTYERIFKLIVDFIEKY